MSARGFGTLVAAAVTAPLLVACGFGADQRVATAAGTTVAPPAGVASSPSSTRVPPFSITIAASGDLLIHNPVRRSAERYAGTKGSFDFDPMFAKVKGLISAADVAICHNETPLTQSDTKLSAPGSMVFNTPHELAGSVKRAGYDGCDFASNHAWDQGAKGLAETIAAYRAAGVQYAGPSASADPPQHVAHYEAKGVKVAHVAYSYTALNEWLPNTHLPPDAPWLRNSLWLAKGAKGILADARAAKKAGADLVVVSLHWGSEYQSEPRRDQRDLATALMASPDVDLILGTHVHVVQPCETINGKLVFYGLGNFLSNQGPSQSPGLLPATQEGMVATVAITRDGSGATTQQATYTPTRVNLDGHVVTPVTAAGNATTWKRVAGVVGRFGDRCTATPTGG